MASIALALLLVQSSIATPSINFSINAQVPPTAQVSALFDFTYLDTTFTSSDSSLNYTLSSAPGWLYLDGAARRLYGTPLEAGAVVFDLVATDDSGSTSMDVTLDVVENIDIEVAEPSEITITSSGSTSGTNEVLLYGSQPFSFSFGEDTFINTSDSTTYYAVSSNNSPLPSWLSFDGHLGFSGYASPLLSPVTKQASSFDLIASNNPGFADARFTFKVVLENHILAFTQSTESLSFASKGQVQTSDYIDQLTYDGSLISLSNLSTVTSDAPDWLTLDKTRISLSGTAPSNAKDTTITITAISTSGYTASMTIYLQTSSLFRGGSREVKAYVGKEFQYDLGAAVLVNSSIDLAVDVGEASAWLRYDQDNQTLYGTAPTAWQGQNATVDLIASLGTINETESMLIIVASAASASEASSTAAATSQTSASRNGGSSSTGNTMTADRNHKALIFLVVLIPISIIAAVLLLLYRRKRKSQINDNEKGEGTAWWIACCCCGRKRQRGIPRDKISRPIPPVAASVSEDSMSSHTDEMVETFVPTHSSPPKLALNPEWGVPSARTSGLKLSAQHNEKPQHKLSTSLDLAALQTLNQELQALSQDHTNRNRQSRVLFAQQPEDHVPFKRDHLNYSRKRPHVRADSTKRRDTGTFSSSRRSDVLSVVSSTLSANYPQPHTRISGAGHGAGGMSGPLGWGNIRESWQYNPNADNDDRTSRPGSNSFVSVFPNAIRFSRAEPRKSWRNSGRGATIRVVKPAQPASPRKRTDYIRDRARDSNTQSPYFSARATSLLSGTRLSRFNSGAGYSNSESSPPLRTRGAFSPSSPIETPSRPPRRSGQTSIGQRLRDSFRYSPGQRSRRSGAGSSRYESADSLALSEDYDLHHSYGPDGQVRWSMRGRELPEHEGIELKEDDDDDDYEDVEDDDDDEEEEGTSSPAGWKLSDVPRRPISVGRSGFQKTGQSQYGNLAFL